MPENIHEAGFEANIEEIDPAFADMNIIRARRDNVQLRAILSNSFGFGGTNASLSPPGENRLAMTRSVPSVWRTSYRTDVLPSFIRARDQSQA